MILSLCKHSFPLQQPGAIGVPPKDCTGCGISYADHLTAVEEQETRQRLAGAARGDCEGCKLPGRMLFTFIPEPQPWHGFDEDAPPNLRLCTPCWSHAKTIDERGEPVTFDQAFHHGTDEQLLDFLGWGS
ncbi:hypothetical protein ACUXZZ_45200 (plasmid) [Streptomyces graminifolii]|uniref:hypothetical protein n=1 Tax=Streptomyces graminifolii TaxID=1266771 RepID=UPI004058204F